MPIVQNKAQISLSLQAMEHGKKLSLGKPAKAYLVP